MKILNSTGLGERDMKIHERFWLASYSLDVKTRLNISYDWPVINCAIGFAFTFHWLVITSLIIYIQKFLHSDWQRACQLIPNSAKT